MKTGHVGSKLSRIFQTSLSPSNAFKLLLGDPAFPGQMRYNASGEFRVYPVGLLPFGRVQKTSKGILIKSLRLSPEIKVVCFYCVCA